MKKTTNKTLLVLIAMVIGLVLGITMIVIGTGIENKVSMGDPDWFDTTTRGRTILFFGVIICIYSVIFSVHFFIVEKYNAPKGLIWLAIANFWGLVLLLILIFRPNGYAARANLVNCPNCGGLIGREFTICPYCHRETRTADPMRYAAPNVAPFGTYAASANAGQPQRQAVFCMNCGM